MRAARVSPLLAATALMVLALPAAAETSSWSATTTSPQKSARDAARKDAGPKVKRKATEVPATPETAKSLKGTLGPATTSAAGQPVPSGAPETSGDDSAYMAFDQGQYLTALKLAEAAAKRGDPAAHTLIARLYSEGLGVGRNEGLALQWYQRGAELGDINAVFALGIAYAEGKGVPKDRTKAAEMFETAAKTGHPLANYNLGMLFLRGDGKPENPYRAAQHIAYAASKGIAQAQYDLATMYQNGLGLPHDAVEASRWLGKAAEQGYAAAQYDYAVMLLRGLGLTKDEPKAVGYMKAAAEKDVPGAQNRLAYIYMEGIGVPKSMVEAAKWRLIARDAVDDPNMDAIVAALPKADRQAAEKAAAEWRDHQALTLGQ